MALRTPRLNAWLEALPWQFLGPGLWGSLAFRVAVTVSADRENRSTVGRCPRR